MSILFEAYMAIVQIAVVIFLSTHAITASLGLMPEPKDLYARRSV